MPANNPEKEAREAHAHEYLKWTKEDAMEVANTAMAVYLLTLFDTEGRDYTVSTARSVIDACLPGEMVAQAFLAILGVQR